MSAFVGAPSMRTLAISLIGAGAVAVVRTMIALGLWGERGTVIIADVGELLIVGGAALTVLVLARHFGAGESLRRQWTLIGLGVLAFALGDAVWVWIEVGLNREVLFPGLPDLFYLSEYAFMGAALLIAAIAYGRLFDIRSAIGFAVTAAIIMLVLLYSGLLEPYILSDASLSTGERILSVFYPVADVLFLLTPSILLIRVVAKLGFGRLGWPWWFVAGGASMLAVSNAGYALMTAAGVYATGAAVDYGWMIAHVLFAVGASLAVDVTMGPETESGPVSLSGGARR